MAAIITAKPPAYLDANGDALAGGSIAYYLKDTTDLVDVFDAYGQVAVTNPVPIDAAGNTVVTTVSDADAAIGIRAVIQDSTGAVVYTIPQVQSDTATPFITFPIQLVTGAITGTANALVMTTGTEFANISTGMLVDVYPTANNTGAATVAIDDIAAIAIKTLDGDDIPADYLRLGVRSTGYYDGTNIRLDRQAENGGAALATGLWRREGDGTLTIRGEAASNGSGGVAVTNLPLAFADANYTLVASNTIDTNRAPAFPSRSNSSFECQNYIANTGARSSASIEYLAIGRWYLRNLV